MQRFLPSLKAVTGVTGLVTMLLVATAVSPVAAYAERRSTVVIAHSEKLALNDQGKSLWFTSAQIRNSPTPNLRLRLRGATRLVRNAHWEVKHLRRRRPAQKATGIGADFTVALRTTVQVRVSGRTKAGQRYSLKSTLRLLRKPLAIGSPTPAPTPEPTETAPPEASPPAPVVTPTATVSPTPTITPTPTPTGVPIVQVGEPSVSLTRGRFETAQRRIIIRPLLPSVDFSQKTISGDGAISLLSDEEVIAQGGIPCTTGVSRFCVVIVHTDSDTTGTFNGEVRLRMHPTGDPGSTRESSIAVQATIQNGATTFTDRFSTVALGSIASAQGKPIITLMRDELVKVAPNSYVADDRPAFDDYNANSSSLWNDSWFNSVFDFSGIAWDAHMAGTAITRCHITLAQHYPRSGTVRFHRKNGTQFSSTIVESRNLSSYGISRDVTVARISPCLEPDMTVYPLLLGSEGLTSALIGSPLINTHFPQGGTRAISAREIGSVFTLLAGGSTTLFPAEVQANAISGDSGNPGFVYYDGTLILVSQFWTGGYGTGPYFGAADLQAALTQALNAMPPP